MSNSKFKMTLAKSLVHVEVTDAKTFSVHLAGDYMNITNKLSTKQLSTVKKAVGKHLLGEKFGRGPTKAK